LIETVLVTGGCGRLGRYVVNELRSRYRVTTLDVVLFYGSAADSFEPQPTLSYLQRTWGTLPEIRKPSVYERNPYAAAVDCAHAREVLGWAPTSDWSRMSGVARQPAPCQQPPE
jgi:hypothetical protein